MLRDLAPIGVPDRVAELARKSRQIGFDMSCDDATGALLRLLATAKPGGRMLEIGTGTGIGAAWILEGMDEASRLTSLDTNESIQGVARSILGDDHRLELLQADGADFLKAAPPDHFDLIFADFGPGKFLVRDLALRAVRRGGFFVVDDLLPQPDWPSERQPLVARFLEEVAKDERVARLALDWSSGLLLTAKR